MRHVVDFFNPVVKVLLFIIFTIGGSQIIYDETLYRGFHLLSFSVYNPILDLDYGRFIFRGVFFVITLMTYFFVKFILSKSKWKDIEFISAKKKALPFFKGVFWGALSILWVILLVWLFNIITFTGIDFSAKSFFAAFFLYLLSSLISAFAFELAFRSFSLKKLAEAFPSHVAVILSSVLYASVFVYHVNDFYPITAFSMGLLLGYSYLLYGFYFVFGFHFIWGFLESIFYSNTIFLSTLELTSDNAKEILNSERIIAFFILTALAIAVLIFKRKKFSRSKKTT
ncbi:MAG: hypothetical protein COT84_06070 [Chlamydiae bacterium CG10_big_fil_rev_8_21_14_0_10_35_9]|nr:MAG: hypothetical protein COT84_06070 [Chlamydiae bacterium CG10_big_fil_rev_8_21_14_0_10_35_9]